MRLKLHIPKTLTTEEKAQIRKAHKSDWAERRYKERKEKGLCVDCGECASEKGSVRCGQCKKDHRERNKKSYSNTRTFNGRNN